MHFHRVASFRSLLNELNDSRNRTQVYAFCIMRKADRRECSIERSWKRNLKRLDESLKTFAMRAESIVYAMGQQQSAFVVEIASPRLGNFQVQLLFSFIIIDDRSVSHRIESIIIFMMQSLFFFHKQLHVSHSAYY
uniref:Myosin motor domain-containing protein n=1 Tax=Ascaris lumbricoides TaxID=6252 RepID=A0A0M3I349_ASCLU